MAINVAFSPAAGLLSKTGDGVDNTIVTSRDAAGQLFVNGGAVPPVTSAAFILKLGTALLITFAAMLVLVHAEIYFSHPLIMQDYTSDVF